MFIIALLKQSNNEILTIVLVLSWPDGDSDGFIRLKFVSPGEILPEELKRDCETVNGKYATA